MTDHEQTNLPGLDAPLDEPEGGTSPADPSPAGSKDHACEYTLKVSVRPGAEPDEEGRVSRADLIPFAETEADLAMWHELWVKRATPGAESPLAWAGADDGALERFLGRVAMSLPEGVFVAYRDGHAILYARQ